MLDLPAAAVTPRFLGRRPLDATEGLPPEHALIVAIWRRLMQDATGGHGDVRDQARAFLRDTRALAYWADLLHVPVERLHTAIEGALTL